MAEVPPGADPTTKTECSLLGVWYRRINLSILQVSLWLELEGVLKSIWVVHHCPGVDVGQEMPQRGNQTYQALGMTSVPLGMKYPSYSSSSTLEWPTPA